MQKTLLKIVSLMATLSILIGCAIIPEPPPPPPAVAPNQSEITAVAISVDLSVYVTFNKSAPFEPEQIFFVKLDDTNTLMQNEIIASNFKYVAGAFEIYVFLLNTTPGRYAAVAATGAIMQGGLGGGRTRRVTVLFPEKMVQASVIDARTGEFSSMGSFYLNSVASMNGADDVQIHYYSQISKGEKIKGYWEGMISESRFVAPTYDAPTREQTPKNEMNFIIAFKEKFENTGWKNLIENRLSYLKKVFH
ncbi:MAG: hypothetical protein C4519_26980 [Desulfobacteraceae bacterium]|nr:MAG: hypothetical protein C4519_26980 [Desulfobacteraceae bacterium]